MATASTRRRPAVDCPEKDATRVATARASLGSLEDHEQVARLFQIFGDPTRLRLITALARAPLCVHELSDVVGLGQSATSHALRILRDRGIARAEREGQMIRYHLADEHIRELLANGWTHALGCDPPRALSKARIGMKGSASRRPARKPEEKKTKR
jgi:DNA-binding transcriptional ArsR family regulator